MIKSKKGFLKKIFKSKNKIKVRKDVDYTSKIKDKKLELLELVHELKELEASLWDDINNNRERIPEKLEHFKSYSKLAISLFGKLEGEEHELDKIEFIDRNSKLAKEIKAVINLFKTLHQLVQNQIKDLHNISNMNSEEIEMILNGNKLEDMMHISQTSGILQKLEQKIKYIKQEIEKNPRAFKATIGTVMLVVMLFGVVGVGFTGSINSQSQDEKTKVEQAFKSFVESRGENGTIGEGHNNSTSDSATMIYDYENVSVKRDLIFLVQQGLIDVNSPEYSKYMTFSYDKSFLFRNLERYNKEKWKIWFNVLEDINFENRVNYEILRHMIFLKIINIANINSQIDKIKRMNISYKGEFFFRTIMGLNLKIQQRFNENLLTQENSFHLLDVLSADIADWQISNIARLLSGSSIANENNLPIYNSETIVDTIQLLLKFNEQQVKAFKVVLGHKCFEYDALSIIHKINEMPLSINNNEVQLYIGDYLESLDNDSLKSFLSSY